MSTLPSSPKPTRRERRAAAIGAIDSDASALDRAVAADVLLRHLFVPPAQRVHGVQYAALYRFAEKHSGGDVIDVYESDAETICMSLTDISGKGVGAALHAALVKYGIRAYASEGHTPSEVLISLNRFYQQNDAFEQISTFASVFFAHVDVRTHRLHYANAGHEPVVVLHPDGRVELLDPTGPVVGILPHEPDLYTDVEIAFEPGALIVAASDGITEARREGEWFGIDRMAQIMLERRDASMREVAAEVIRAAVSFARQRVIDDMAVLAARME